MDDVRRAILEAVAERGTNLADVSRQIGKNHAYLQQFIRRHVPDRLPETVRPKLAEVLGLTEEVLGGRPSVSPYQGDMIRIPEHDVRASAGPGSIIDGETEIEQWPMPRSYVRDALSLRSSSLAIIEVIGDSMEPTLRSGDKIMVDLDDKSIAQPGVFALYDGDATVVKRVERVLGTDRIMVKSDNPLHGSYEVHADFISVAGRVVWFGRRL